MPVTINTQLSEFRKEVSAEARHDAGELLEDIKRDVTGGGKLPLPTAPRVERALIQAWLAGASWAILRGEEGVSGMVSVMSEATLAAMSDHDEQR